jgi:thiosulfate reductase / polysulfide reductase chain A
MAAKVTGVPEAPVWQARARVEDGTHQTICWDCYNACGINVEVKNGIGVRVRGDAAHPGSKGYICIRGVNSLELQNYPGRLKYPMVRVRRPGQKRGEGVWKRASWDEAIDTIVDGFQAVREKYSPLSLCAMASNAYYTRGVAATLLMRSFGSPNVCGNDDV